MIQKLWFHFLIGGLALLFTFLISIGNNTMITSLARSFFGFLLFFFLMFPIRWFFMKPLGMEPADDQATGMKVNVQTPDEDLAQQIANNAEYCQQDNTPGGFTPLSPPVLKKKQETSESMSSEDIANAIRVLSS